MGRKRHTPEQVINKSNGNLSAQVMDFNTRQRGKGDRG